MSTINEETHPHIAELVDTMLHNEIVDKLKTYLENEECLSEYEILHTIDKCYDENNIPSTITMDTIERIVESVDDFEQYLDEEWALANVDKFKELNNSLSKPKTIKGKLVHHHTVIDPDTGGEVVVCIVKLETGGMIGIDASFLENTEEPVYSPFDKNIELDLDI